MSELDATVAKVLDKERPNIKDDDDNEDELLDELESDEAALDAFREKRMQQLHDEYASTEQITSFILWLMFAIQDDEGEANAGPEPWWLSGNNIRKGGYGLHHVCT